MIRTKAKRKKRTRCKLHGCGKWSDHLPRLNNPIPVAQENRICAVCAALKVCTEHKVSEHLDYVPAQATCSTRYARKTRLPAWRERSQDGADRAKSH